MNNTSGNKSCKHEHAGYHLAVRHVARESIQYKLWKCDDCGSRWWEQA